MTNSILLVEDNQRLRDSLKTGLEDLADFVISHDCDSGEEAVAACFQSETDAVLMDVQLAGDMNGIQAAVEIRREFPRMPVVFYSIQDDDSYYRDFRRSGILSHYAYVRKSNHLLPHMIATLLKDAIAGRSYIDPEIEARVHEVRQKDAQSPMALLEPNERQVAEMLAAGMTNEQIAAKLGFRDKRTISRTNGQIYAAWGLNTTSTDEKIARTRAAIIARNGVMLKWDENGAAYTMDERGEWEPWEPA